jgi:heme A synthase
MIQKLVSSGILFFVAIGTGVWLSNLGKPYNTLAFTVHKLIALATVIITVVLTRSLLKNVEYKTVVVTLIIVTVLFVLALFISGALMSAGIGRYSLFKTAHNIATILTAGTAAAVLYLLLNKK